MKDNMLFINENSIPAAQLPNNFVYVSVDGLAYYGFDVDIELSYDFNTKDLPELLREGLLKIGG